MFELPQASGKARAAADGSRNSIIAKHRLAPGLLQCRKLQRRVLIICGDAGVADFHALYFALDICNTPEQMFTGLPRLMQTYPLRNAMGCPF
jgi:hypothetical protein